MNLRTECKYPALNTRAPITPGQGFTCLDLGTFVISTDGSKNEVDGHIYQGADAYSWSPRTS